MLDSNENVQQNAETGHGAKYVVRLEEYGGKNPLFHCFWNGKNFDLKELSEAKKFNTWNEVYVEMNRFGYKLGREYTILEIKEDVPEEERSTGPKLFISQPMKGKTDGGNHGGAFSDHRRGSETLRRRQDHRFVLRRARYVESGPVSFQGFGETGLCGHRLVRARLE